MIQSTSINEFNQAINQPKNEIKYSPSCLSINYLIKPWSQFIKDGKWWLLSVKQYLNKPYSVELTSTSKKGKKEACDELLNLLNYPL